MSVEIKVQIKNTEQIITALKLVPIKMISELDKAVKRIILRVEGDAKKFAPVQRKGGGNLRQSIKSQVTGIARGMVAVGANYGIYVHEGTAPHIIRVSTKKGLANKRTGQFFGKVVRHPGTKANPFLQGAVSINEDFIDEQFANAVTNALK